MVWGLRQKGIILAKNVSGNNQNSNTDTFF